ncbi:MAG TPA: oligopeptide/dipeptide ABC transporter ATP-binding protein [Tepidisphaeraceae bacterium]|jgi:oligopeptide/dipeptide ABC transporter ATP-binding protein
MNESASSVVAYERPKDMAIVAPPDRGTPLLEVRDLKTWFPIRRGVFSRTVGHVKAVDGVSFDLAPGKTLGLVGESGCGKTTAGRTILRLIPATGGTVRYKGEDFFAYRGRELRELRRQMQIVFQDPVSSLNPRMTIGNIIGEPIEVHGIAKGREKNDLVAALLQRVGLDPSYAARYPHEFSGGQRQRIGIARALSLSPNFIVCDEPVSALDVSIQSQILNLLDDLQKERGIAYLFIAHNLAVVEHFSDEVAVMYLGRIVEKAASRELYKNPKHPYTVALLSAIPEPDPRPRKRRIILPGEVPSPSNPPTGCHFHPRCPLTRQKAAEAGAGDTVQITYKGENLDGATTNGNGAVSSARVMRKCVEQSPPLEQKQGQPGHVAACWFTS